MATAARTGASPSLKWWGALLAILAVVALGVWAGTHEQRQAVRPADTAYLKTNAKKTGVHITSSGLQYEVLRQGTGPRPDRGDTVAVQYEGRLIDGTVFDSTYQRGQPAIFPIDQVIPGWSEGVQLMPAGSKYRFTIPPSLGYGQNGVPPVIPGGSVLVFDVELLAIRGKS
jgi:FKBP-type peptidyl-prolyl cis-trans isomerase